MFDTRLTVVGTVLTQPEPRHTITTNALVTSFKVVSNSRRLDKDRNTWVDSGHFRVRVNCWRRLAEGVLASVNVGDPIIVRGRIQTKEWKTEQGEPRLSYELDADSVGHDLARGRATFSKGRPGDGLVVEDPEDAAEFKAPPGVDDEAYEPESFAEGGSDRDALTILREAGLGPAFAGLDGDGGHSDGGLSDGGLGGDEDGEDEDEIAGADAGSGGSGGRGRRRGRQPVPA